MAHIYIYSPAGAVRDKAGFKRGVRRLESQGHQIEIDKDALTSHERFAGDDETRLQAISRAACSGADLTLITRGGYGLTRILPQINYKLVSQSIAKGTRWMGYSDFTAFQAALFAQTGASTIAGASLIADFGVATPKESVDEITEACFGDVLLGQNEGAGWTLPKRTQADRALYEQYAAKPLSIKASSLWGGNLSVLTSLIGTPYLPQVAGGVLWFEDTGESPFRIERMLTQWLNAGILARQKAIVLGQFTESKLYPHDRGFNFASVVARLRAQLKIPVLTHLPFGHVPTKVMLPFGAPARLLCDGSDALLLWDDL
ncbi:MAG: LD-carboxypeptidase [Cytophagales bacterium]|nr:LD-carboxypeptidase [Cytophagales bacterium]